MRYIVKARLKPGRERALREAVANGSLGRGSVAGGEYLENMRTARLGEDGVARWVETCFCETPLEEEKSYWDEYFNILAIKDAHARRNCRDLNGTEAWACCDCNCTRRLQERLARSGKSFLDELNIACGRKDVTPQEDA